MTNRPLDVAYVAYSGQSGVTRRVLEALSERGHRLQGVRPTGPLDIRDPDTAAWRVSPRGILNLAVSLRWHGLSRVAYHHRINTPYAFDVHSREAGRILAALDRRPDVVLQNGALFSPGLPPRFPYVLFCDYTGALATRAAASDPSLGRFANLGGGWRRREEAVYRGAHAIATFSRRTARSLEEDYGVPAARLAVVGGGANVFPERVDRRHDGRTLLFIGKEWARKGGPVLAVAFERLRRRVPDARLLVVGPHETPPLPEGATCLGRVDVDELPALCAAATVFVMPTLREPYGLAFLDAMACGLPCVGTRVDAVPEIVEHERTGLVVPPGDADALAGALERLLADPEAAEAMGRRGREKVERGHRWSHVAERIEALCREAARQGARAARPVPVW
jgi:glycosyltransferase involved in cell wall biosynthesis